LLVNGKIVIQNKGGFLMVSLNPLALILVLSVISFIIMVIVVIMIVRIFINLSNEKSADKKKNIDKSTIIILSSLLLLFVILMIINISTIFSSLYKNRDAILNGSLNATSQIVSTGIGMTFDAIEKGWDNMTVRKLKNIDVSVSKYSKTLSNSDITYSFEIVFDDHNENNPNISYSSLVEGKYLVVCDKDDVFYSLNPVNVPQGDLPASKTKADFEVTVSKDVDLEYIRYITNKIFFNK
jgi:heme/copper-type cytochrome/quinol oxidase subunit 2